MLSHKECSKCHNQFTLDMFGKDKSSSTGYHSHCKLCSRDRTKLRRQKLAKEPKQTPDSKVCKHCEESKPCDEFSKNYLRADGLSHVCKACYTVQRNAAKAKRQNTSITVNEQMTKLCFECRLLKNASLFSINLKTQDKLSHVCKDCAPKNTWTPEKQRISEKKYREANPAKMKEKYRRQGEKVHRRIRDRLNHRIAEALLTKNVTKRNKTVEYLGCSIQFFKQWVEFQFTEDMSWENMGKWHLDHVKPCAAFNFERAGDIQACFNWKNYQPLWGRCNILKGSRVDQSLIEAHAEKALEFEAYFSAQTKEGELLETP